MLVITKLDRLARSMFDLQGIVQTLERKKADLVVLDQKIDTTTPTGRLTFHLLGAVAEFERDLINERRNEGMERAKQKGVRFGRKPKLTDLEIEELRAAHRAGEEPKALMERFGISKTTFYRLCPTPPAPSLCANNRHKRIACSAYGIVGLPVLSIAAMQ